MVRIMWGGGPEQWRPCSSHACDLVSNLQLDTTATKVIIPDREKGTDQPLLPSEGPHIQGSVLHPGKEAAHHSCHQDGPVVSTIPESPSGRTTGALICCWLSTVCEPDDMQYYSVYWQEEASEGNLCFWRLFRPLYPPPAASIKHKASSRTVHWLPPSMPHQGLLVKKTKNWHFTKGTHTHSQSELSNNRWTKGGSITVEKEHNVSMVICSEVEPLTVPGLISECSLIRANL